MPEQPSHSAPARPFIVLFDGDCVLCNTWARFVAARDPDQQFLLGTLQSPTGQRLLREHGVAPTLQSVVMLWPGGSAAKSDAILRMLSHLSAPWPAAAVFRIAPRFVRDRVYDFIAAHRYRWFGKEESCPLPTPAMRARLLPDG